MEWSNSTNIRTEFLMTNICTFPGCIMQQFVYGEIHIEFLLEIIKKPRGIKKQQDYTGKQCRSAHRSRSRSGKEANHQPLRGH
jgi:hypothetical protein